MAGPDEEDPFSDLRHTFEGDDRLDDSPVPSSTRASAAALPRSTSTAPPPLPARRLAPVDRVSSNPLPRSQDDPFHEPPEPRLPHGLPEEKLEFFRAVLKQKQETLARARALFAEREAEARNLRETVQSLKEQLDPALEMISQLQDLPAQFEQLSAALEGERQRASQAETRVGELESELQSSAKDRRDLSAALAEVEAQVIEMTAQSKSEQYSRALLGKEFMEAQESLTSFQNQISEMTAQKSEVEGNLEAIQEQYQAVASENERISTELARASEDLKRALAERDLAQKTHKGVGARASSLEKWAAEAQEKMRALEKAVEETRHRAESSERALAEATSQADPRLAEALRKMQAWEKSAAEAQRRHQSLKQETEVVRRKLEEAELASRSERGEREALEERLQQLEQAKTESAVSPELVEERDRLKADVAAMKKKLMVAESALEMAALLKAKLARLEAQLKQKK